MNIQKELSKRLMNQDDVGKKLEDYNREIGFYEMIASGDTDRMAERLKIFNSGRTTRGHLSDNEIANSRYHAVVLAAMASRFCIEKGMEIGLAYTLSDIYIELIDKAKSDDEVDELAKSMCMDYCKYMKELTRKSVVSRHIVMAVDYIRTHVQDPLTVESIADALSLNPSYLSKLFKQEMGKTISKYIRDQKIAIACNMLRHLDESSLSIANYLGFSSQSHFIQVFKKSVGMTPEEYRKNNYHQSWMSKKGE